ncbi:FAD/NAD-P-binding domain-containing protein [Peniophora sp. CONT]|nr:FAD/NAD-P-binding domain-containing protein [Peniophora sp. CONT]
MAIFSRLPSLAWRRKNASTPNHDATSSVEALLPAPVAQDTTTALAAHGVQLDPPPTRVLNGAGPPKPLNIQPATPVISAPDPTPQAPRLNGHAATNGYSATPSTSLPNGQANAHTSTYVPPDFAIDEWRRMKVVVIGAGYSGITAGIRFSQRVPNLDLTIYEKESAIGGTWHVNRYPGLMCDIPSHCYQLTFAPNTQWSGFYAPGPEIRAYLQGVVDKWKLARFLKLRHELVGAKWDESAKKWRLRMRRFAEKEGGGEVAEEFDDDADVLFLGTGTLSRWKWPDIPGLDTFKGIVLHSAQFAGDEDKEWEEVVQDWGDKRVGVIGNGSTGIQVVAALQPRVKTLVNFARQKTWLSALFSVRSMFELIGRDPASGLYDFPEDFKKRLASDPEFYEKFRHAVEHDLNSVAWVTIRGSDMQKAAADAFRADMEAKLAQRPDLKDKIIPDFAVCCRRLTPGPGYLEALCEENATLETTPIARMTPTGAVLSDGRTHDLDVLVCATGFDVSYTYPFPILGRHSTPLSTRWTPHPEAYLALAVDGFPNLFLGLGPNSGVNSGSLLVLMERQVDYAVDATLKMQRERIACMEVKASAVRAWREYMKGFFPKTVFNDGCKNWYSAPDGHIRALWPGTCLHAVRTLSNPRWEDWEYTPLDGDEVTGGNPMYWLGNGMSANEKSMTGDRAWYLDGVDIPPVPV